MMAARDGRTLRAGLALVAICLLCRSVEARYGGGSGTADDPYQIATAADLIALGETSADYDKYSILTADIDLDPNLPGRTVFAAAIIAPNRDRTSDVFQGTPFTGIFDGNDHVISHLTVDGVGYLGLFGQLAAKAEVKDVGVVDVSIIGSGNYVGSLVGFNYTGKVTRCYSTGAVIGNENVGGLVGWNDYGLVAASHNTGTVTGGRYIGGLAGKNYFGRITTSYCTGIVTGQYAVGGLVGGNEEVSRTWDPLRGITTSYSTCAVTGRDIVGGLAGDNDGRIVAGYSTGTVTGETRVGGLVGRQQRGGIVTSYGTGAVSGDESVGGLVGSGSPAQVMHSVWNKESSGVSGSVGAVSLSTAEMMDPQMLGLNGFANDPAWILDPGQDHPRLAWENTPGTIVPEPDIGWLAGDGTAEAPYRIDTVEQLLLLGKASVLWDKHFVLVADVDLDPNLPGRESFDQALIQTFAGVFDGRGHTISHLAVKGGSYLGLFAYLGGQAEVKDLGVVDVDIIGSGDYVGSLVGFNYTGKVTRCYSTGAVGGNKDIGGLVGWNEVGRVAGSHNAGMVAGSVDVGGLVGRNWYGSITASYSTGMVSGEGDVGGLVGCNDYHGNLVQSSSDDVVSGTGEWSFGVGGLVGWNRGAVIRCYSRGAVSGVDCVGGLVGQSGVADKMEGEIIESYSTGAVTGKTNCAGGLVGGNASAVTYCYSTGAVGDQEGVGGLVGCNWCGVVAGCAWDIQTSGRVTSGGGTGKTTAEMQTARTFLDAGWDFIGETANGAEDIWWIDEGKSYPRLWWEARQYAGGTGEPNDPYLILTAAQLNAIGVLPHDWDKHFQLMADIDLSPFDGKAGRPAFHIIGIGYANGFTGVFDGNGHTISGFTYQSNAYIHDMGLFGRVGAPADIRDIRLIAPVVEASQGHDVGALVGWLVAGTVAGCRVEGGTVTGTDFTGGLIGLKGGGTVVHCCATAAVSGEFTTGGLAGANNGTVLDCLVGGPVTAGECTGGLVGRNDGTIAECCTIDIVTGADLTGGLVGDNFGTVANCYSTAAVASGATVGGLTGRNWGTITACYSAGTVSATPIAGGLAGLSYGGSVSHSFWDMEASGRDISAGGIGKTTAQMRTAATYLAVGWDFAAETANGTADIWWIEEGKDYPRLWWELAQDPAPE